MEKVKHVWVDEVEKELARDMDYAVKGASPGEYARMKIGTDTAKEASYGEYARVKIVTDSAAASAPDGWFVGMPLKEEGTTINWPSSGSSFTVSTKQIPPDCKDLKDVSDMAQLLSEAGQSSLHDLCNLWQARWGLQWVKRGEIEGEFWEVAAARLHAAARLEAHVLADGTRVFKLDNE